MTIIHAHSSEHLDSVRTLFQEYWDSSRFTPCFQNFGAEVASLPGKYSPPEGRLALAMVGSEPGGCIALRRFDDGRCEAKRLYVRDRFRGLGIGRALLNWLIAEARAAGYREMLADTMPQMTQALAWYERIGFERIAPYRDNPPEVLHFRLQL
jgi:ribosomal protein S18 acetylase RimI-like enzyme